MDNREVGIEDSRQNRDGEVNMTTISDDAEKSFTYTIRNDALFLDYYGIIQILALRDAWNTWMRKFGAFDLKGRAVIDEATTNG